MLPAHVLAGYPSETRVIMRRERPAPAGAQLDAFEERDGYRYPAFATGTPADNSPNSTAATAHTPGSKTASAPRRTSA